MSNERVVSLTPSATATLAAAGLADCLVGITHHCDPGEDAPVDVERVGGWLNPDESTIDALDPDLLLTCDDLQRDLCEDLAARGFEVHHREPSTLADVRDCLAAIPATVGDPDAGKRLRERAERRLDAVAEAVVDAERPVVYCEEWSDPPMAAGNWVPDAVRAAGGRYPFLDAGERSREVSEGTVADAEPDHVVLHVCGRGDRVSASTLTERGWDVDAAVHVVDDDLLNQPGPRLVEGIETLAARLHPERVDV